MSSILQEMINSAPTQAAAAQASINQIQTSINDLISKRNALKTDIGDVVATNIENYLIGTKFTPVVDHFMLKGSNFNQILSETGNIMDWKIYKKISLTNLTFVNATTFECGGDQRSTFVTNKDLSFLLGSTRVYNTVSSSSFADSKTTVILTSAVLNASLASVWPLHYKYGDTVDTILNGHKTNWDFAHDYIMRPMGMSGTYGLQDNIEKLTNSIALLNENKTKLNNSITIFSNFI